MPKYQLDTAKQFYKWNKKDTDDVLALKELGMVFSNYRTYSGVMEIYTEEEGEVEINTLEELNSFIVRWGALVITDAQIVIYNDYME